MAKIKPKFKFRLRLNPFLFIRNKDVHYEDPDGMYEVYELFKLVFPFVYKFTGTWTIHERGRPHDFNKLHRIIEKYKEKGHV